jgi:CcmD family protein
VDNLGYLLSALAAIAVGLLGYLFYLGQRLREVRRDLAALDAERRDREVTGQAGERAR